jgi:hypothetical protein
MEEMVMKKMNTTSLAVIAVAGALTAFLWLPLLPIIVPLVTVAFGLRWASALLDSEAGFGRATPQFKLLQFPIHKVPPPRQAPRSEARPSSANLSSPARAGSLSPRKGEKNYKRQIRESRQIARVLNGLELRRSAPGF